jgi:UDP:flavonoid glycosyltransferase YjiC (YdhE family)
LQRKRRAVATSFRTASAQYKHQSKQKDGSFTFQKHTHKAKHLSAVAVSTRQEEMQQRKKVLVCALDWGLGHATRCIPVIEALEKLDFEVVLASSGKALAFWQQYFPGHQFLPLSPMKVEYRQSAWWSALVQSPRLLLKLFGEDRKIIQQAALENDFSLVISDNRYGCFLHNKPAVLISNQLSLLPPPGKNTVFNWVWKTIWRYFFKRFAANFKEIWIPDLENDAQSLAGDMLKNPSPKPLRYLGIISRLPTVHTEPNKHGSLLLLSGPEPQRSKLEALLLAKAHELPQPVLLIRGTDTPPAPALAANIRYENQLSNPEKMSQYIQQHALVVCRPGHSTLSDLYQTGARFVTIPTPGQPEQAYLSRRLAEQKIAPFCEQNQLNIPQLLSKLDNFTGFRPHPRADLVKSIQHFLDAHPL